MRAPRNHALTLWLAQKPCFCVCCWCLSRQDTQRTKRVLRLVRAVVKDWEEARRIDEDGTRQT
ncbi:MAG: hypothetical protein MUC37_11885 [Hyphomicrobium sp.]|jgi:hypothetical protein|nr:hypothetical protein [Hyphomicrobium sp.]